MDTSRLAPWRGRPRAVKRLTAWSDSADQTCAPGSEMDNPLAEIMSDEFRPWIQVEATARFARHGWPDKVGSSNRLASSTDVATRTDGRTA